MIVPELVSPIAPEEFAASAGAIWRTARERAKGKRAEIYVKTSWRRRVASAGRGESPLVFETVESGTALRLASARGSGSFAALPGVSPSIARELLELIDRAPRPDAGEMPAAGSVGEGTRWDLDEDSPLPPVERLASALPVGVAGWVESGITLEALVGDGEWVAVRRRNRTWGLLERERPTLVAARGFQLLGSPGPLDRAEPPYLAPSSDDGPIILSPSGAAPLVAALAGILHGADGVGGFEVGPGWSLADEPGHPLGIAGGRFDDAGFPTGTRELANGRRSVERLVGPGTLRRSSFREPPRPAPSTLVLRPGTSAPVSGRNFTRCRVIPVEPGEWLLQLDPGVGSLSPVFVRTTPAVLVRCCRGTLGEARIGAEGVLTPGLLLDSLPTESGIGLSDRPPGLGGRI